MRITRPNAQPLTTEELQSIERLKVVICRATANGRVNRTELDSINAQIHEDHKVTYEELEVFREMVLAKIQAGELEWEWD